MINCIIIDDEPLAREGLLDYVKDVEFLHSCGEASSALEIPGLLNENRVDLMFLDIQMPKINGLTFLRSTITKPLTIITTAYPDYALDGFELDVVDYLVKPIPFDRFFMAASKAKKQFDLENHQPHDATINSTDSFFIRCDGKYERIYQQDILFVQAMQNYVLIQTNTRKYMTLLYLKTVAEKLNPEQFIRVHKSYIIALDKVDNMSNMEVQIKDFKIPISRNYRKDVLDRIVGNRLWEK